MDTGAASKSVEDDQAGERVCECDSEQVRSQVCSRSPDKSSREEFVVQLRRNIMEERSDDVEL
eukprot:618436-Hanusia_phi.AAC.1